jgi:hypothetical protein
MVELIEFFLELIFPVLSLAVAPTVGPITRYLIVLLLMIDADSYLSNAISLVMVLCKLLIFSVSDAHSILLLASLIIVLLIYMAAANLLSRDLRELKQT